MTRQEFLEKLNNLLSDIPKTERESAIQYYREYFEEAGVGEYDNIPQDMEAPEVIAENICAGLGNDVKPEEDYFKKEEQTKQNTQQGKQKMDSSKIILLIILAVFTSPLWGGLLLSVFGVLIGVLCTLLGIVIAIAAVMVSFLAAGIIVAVVGAVKTVVSPIAGITAMGVGILLFGLGLLLLLLVIWSFSVLFPAVFKGIRWMFRRIFERRAINEKAL